MRISANFLLFALSRSNLGNNKVKKTNMHGTTRSSLRKLSWLDLCGHFADLFLPRFHRTPHAPGWCITGDHGQPDTCPNPARHRRRRRRPKPPQWLATAKPRRGRRRSGRPPAPHLRRAHARASSPSVIAVRRQLGRRPLKTGGTGGGPRTLLGEGGTARALLRRDNSHLLARGRCARGRGRRARGGVRARPGRTGPEAEGECTRAPEEERPEEWGARTGPRRTVRRRSARTGRAGPEGEYARGNGGATLLSS